ncbi:hypothetical protein XELAEV_18035337mg [Xenopus laevis]|uniref:Uncharacterized protein n=1 Tax=Xenopus laevis TaxID=8355 RepID=A0A974CGV7_XENLA|nr:hypothetical protein XELAEV_18035337mg [Xenopus laevis]
MLNDLNNTYCKKLKQIKTNCKVCNLNQRNIYFNTNVLHTATAVRELVWEGGRFLFYNLSQVSFSHLGEALEDFWPQIFRGLNSVVILIFSCGVSEECVSITLKEIPVGTK